jgi:LPXTG-motif cell wall-anchored protein
LPWVIEFLNEAEATPAELPRTGAPSGIAVIVAAALVSGGALLLGTKRRR